jgi:hypothetical protein
LVFEKHGLLFYIFVLFKETFACAMRILSQRGT